MQFAIVNVPAAPVRRKADHRSEMVNQLLFGETVQVLRKKGKLWLKVRSLHDGYEGWLTNTLVQETDEMAARQEQSFILTDLIAKAMVEETAYLITAGAVFSGLKDGKAIACGKEFEVNGRLTNRFEERVTAATVEAITRPWLNTPYLWGGRSPMGVDCSGFTQVIYKQLGIDLPRDAWQQALVGEAVNDFYEAQPGDLVFFGKKERVTHVGIMLSASQLIHASGRVRIDNIQKHGVTDAESGKLMLKLKAIRRYS